MTYGDHAGEICDELAGLLASHRIQQRLGGQGSHTVPESTTRSERHELGQVIRRYRYAVLVWCAQALRAASDKTEPARSPADRTPVEELQVRVDQTLSGGPGKLRLVDLLCTPHRFPLITRWQHLARAAALGEHDFAADVNRGSLTSDQLGTVVYDVALVVRALAVLDARYELVPGWRTLERRQRLARAAIRVGEDFSSSPRHSTTDTRGWRPQPTPRQHRLDGLPGAVDAQHNVVVELAHLPSALNLRRVIYLQVLTSLHAVRQAGQVAPDLAARFEERTQVYRQLLAQSRNLAGLLGSGTGAVCESHRVLDCLRGPASRDDADRQTLLDLGRLFTATDARIGVQIERGLAERAYFVGVPMPWIGEEPAGGVIRPGVRYMPSSAEPPNTILPLIRDRFRPAPVVQRAATRRDDRAALERILAQTPSVVRSRRR